MNFLYVLTYSIIAILIFNFFLPSSLLFSEIHKCVTKEGEIVYTTNPSTIEGCINKTEIPKQKYKDVEINTDLEYETNENEDKDKRYKIILKQENKTEEPIENSNINSGQIEQYDETLSNDNLLPDTSSIIGGINDTDKKYTNIKNYNIGSNQKRIRHYEKVLEQCLKSAVPTSREIKCGKFRKKLQEEYEKANYVTSENPQDSMSNITSSTGTLDIRLINCVKHSPPSPSRDYNCWKLEKKIIDITNVTTCRVTTIIDGDTFNCILRSGVERTIRLIGINTPELDEQGGQEALYFLAQVLGTYENLKLEFDIQFEDRYRRILAYVYLPNGKMINELLLEQGLAQVMTIKPNVKYSDRFRSLELN